MFCRPESLGIVVGIVFLVFAILFQHFNFTSDSIVSLFCFNSCLSDNLVRFSTVVYMFSLLYLGGITF